MALSSLITRLVDGDGVLLETGDLVQVFQSHDGEGGGGEAVSAGVASGTGLALGSARAGAFGGVGAVGGELLFGYRHAKWSFLLQR